MFIKILILLFAVLVFSSSDLSKETTLKSQKNIIPKVSLQKIDWYNFEYIPGWMTLKNGRNEIHEYYEMGQPHDTTIWTLKDICYGDINNDKIEDAVIIIKEMSDNYRAKKSYNYLRKHFYTTKNNKLLKLEIKKPKSIDIKKLNCQNKDKIKNKKVKKSLLNDVDWNNFKPLKLVNGKIFIKNLSDFKGNGRTARSLSLFNVCYGDFNNDKVKDALVLIRYSMFHTSGHSSDSIRKHFYSTKAGKIIKIKVKNKDKIDLKKLNCIYKKDLN